MTETEIHKICKKNKISNYSINNDMSIDVDGSVYFGNTIFSLKKLPINFNKVTGDFICHREVLTSLDGSPNELGGVFICNFNKLKSLKGCPKIVDDFQCVANNIQSLEDGPEIVKDMFSIGRNPELNSLKGSPKKIKILNCSDCNIKTFQYFPEIDELNMYGNPLSELWHLFDNVNYIEYFNELDIIIDDGETVILDRLNYFLQDLGIDKEITSLKNYNTIN